MNQSDIEDMHRNYEEMSDGLFCVIAQKHLVEMMSYRMGEDVMYEIDFLTLKDEENDSYVNSWNVNTKGMRADFELVEQQHFVDRQSAYACFTAYIKDKSNIA